MCSSQAAESFRGLLLRHRARTGLIQRDLAARAGVSRRSVQEWETGVAFPSAERLQALIRVLLEAAGLTAGREALEARELWTAVRREAPRMHTPFDEQWFAGLLVAHAPPTAHPPTDTLDSAGAAERETGPAERAQDWGDAPDTVGFVGRAEELAQLRHWVLDERCRLATVVGMGGIGKTSLAARLARDVAPEFERVYWRGLRDAPPLSDWLAGAIGFLSDQQQASARSESERLTTLLQLLRERRCLLVLDNFETLFEPGQHLGRYRQGLTGYGHLVEVAAAAGHRSCVLLTSREAPAELAVLEGGAVRIFPLGGLAVDDVQVLLAAKRLTGTGDQWTELIARFGGNGLALKVVGESIRLVFGGDLGEYLEFGTAGAFGGIRRVLAEQIARSSALEQQVLRVLAVEREPLSLSQLLLDLGPRFGTANVIDAIEALRRRSLLESAETPGPAAFTLQSVVLEYVTEQLVQEVSHEIASGQPAQVVAQLLIKALGKDYVRQSQQRLIGEPVLRQLAAEVGEDLVEPRLLALLETWRDRSPKEQGYGPGNVVNLLSLRRGDLRSLDLSRLSLRGVYLQGLQMQDTSLSGASISESMATQAFDACWAVTISQDGQIWAAASKRGEVRVWQRSDQTLQLAWDAHTNIVPTIAVSPDGRRLATGSYDGSITVWDVSVGALLWTSRHTDSIYSVAFAPDGALLASGGNDASARLWDADTGALLQTVPHTDPVFTVAWSPDGRWLASGGFTGQIRLWEIDKAAGAARCVETLEATATGS